MNDLAVQKYADMIAADEKRILMPRLVENHRAAVDHGIKRYSRIRGHVKFRSDRRVFIMGVLTDDKTGTVDHRREKYRGTVAAESRRIQFYPERKRCRRVTEQRHVRYGVGRRRGRKRIRISPHSGKRRDGIKMERVSERGSKRRSDSDGIEHRISDRRGSLEAHARSDHPVQNGIPRSVFLMRRQYISQIIDYERSPRIGREPHRERNAVRARVFLKRIRKRARQAETAAVNGRFPGSEERLPGIHSPVHIPQA